MKVAIVHYWLVRMRGGEKVLEQLCHLFPDADIFTHVFDPDGVVPAIKRHRIRTTFINRLPFAKRRYPYYLALMPMALEQLDLSEYDLVISSESGPAKGVLVRPDAVHICYCHTPMRYLWNMHHFYLSHGSALKRLLMAPQMHYLRIWDRVSADRVDLYVANSANTARRIRRYYNHSATVVYPPVDIDSFQPVAAHDGYYLTVSHVVPYKRVDIAVEAFNRLGLPLHLVGDGGEIARLKKLAKPNIQFLGWVSGDALRAQYQNCKALVFPGEEDFGIVPVEAMASGKPVIAYGKGGVLETVIPDRTGILFPEQTADSLHDAVRKFEAIADAFDANEIAAFAENFSTIRFRSRMSETIAKALASAARAPLVEPFGRSVVGSRERETFAVSRVRPTGEAPAPMSPPSEDARTKIR